MMMPAVQRLSYMVLPATAAIYGNDCRLNGTGSFKEDVYGNAEIPHEDSVQV